MPFELAENLVQALGGGPEGWVVLVKAGFHVHGCSATPWTT
jgi:hypothetical protein